jgi:hypothetical protein
MTAPNSVVEPIEKSWQQLNTLVESLGPHGLAMTGADGWAVKDHLVHLAAWEHSLIALLEGADRRTAMGVAGEAEDTDSINAAVWSLHQSKTPEQALAYFRDTHAVLVELLGKMSDADLQLSYNHYQPDDPRNTDDDRPVRDWVAGNTYEHYAEHTEWINQVLKDSSAAR